MNNNCFKEFSLFQPTALSSFASLRMPGIGKWSLYIIRKACSLKAGYNIVLAKAMAFTRIR
nr:MAG TPA: hypothetical protein [Caudoviricetes sp.]